MYEQEVKKLREKTLKEYKIRKLAELEDKKAKIKSDYLKNIEEIELAKKRVEDTKFINTNDDSVFPDYGNLYNICRG